MSGLVDILVFFGFIATVLFVGMWKSRGTQTHTENSEGGAADYFLAGRGLKWWLIGVSLIAANISAEQFVGMSGQAADYLGLAIASYEWLAAVTLIVVAFCFLPYFLKTGIYTIPEFLEHRYNATARTIMAVFTMILLIGVSLAGVIYAGALPMCELFRMYEINIDLTTCCWAMGAMAALYVAFGGLKACAWADLIQGTALILGGAIITWFAFRALGATPLADLWVAQGVGATTAVVPGTAIAGLTESSGSITRFFALNQDKLHMALPSSDLILPVTALMVGLWIPNFYYWGLNQYITQRLLGSASLAEGQKGIVLAAALKLVVPFIIVFPGIIAFNLYKGEMVKSAETSPKTLYANEEILKNFEADKNLTPAQSAYKIYPIDYFWGESNKEKAAEITAYNAKVETALELRKAAALSPEAKAEAAALKIQKADTLVGIKYDTALNHLIGNLLKPGNGLLGFVLAALLGAIVSSLAAVLNAASTVFTMDIFNKFIQKDAPQEKLVVVGRICIGVFVVLGCLVAPALDNPKFGGIFTYIQEFQGFVSPGILAAFVFGLINRRAGGITGVLALVLNPILYGALKWGCPNIAFLDRMAICLGILLVVMTVVGLVIKHDKPVEFHAKTKLNLEPSRGAQICAIIVLIATACLYWYFW